LLSSWDVPFDLVDIEAEPGACVELRRLGVPAVPAVVVAGGVVHGWNPRALAELLGVRYEGVQRLSPAELAKRLDQVLAAAARVVSVVVPEHLALQHPGRDRSLHQLAYHLFRLSLAFRDAMVERRLPEAWLQEMAPPGLPDGAALAGYGMAVRAALRGWLAAEDAVSGTVETYYGSQSAHELLERTVWHAVQHLRQIHALLADAGTPPAEPLAPSLLERLPLPQSVW
jgi:DinB superfamily